MQVGHITPNIVRFTYRQEKGDPGYGSCMWADFDFDLNNYDLSIHSDCGYYGYGWCVTPSEPFLELIARIHDDYLLNKLCKKSVVNWQATREALCEAIADQDNLDEDEYNEAISDLDCLADDYDLEDDIGVCTVYIEKWNTDHYQLDDVYEYVYTDYTGDEKKIVSVFRDYIQPAIREYLKETDA